MSGQIGGPSGYSAGAVFWVHIQGKVSPPEQKGGLLTGLVVGELHTENVSLVCCVCDCVHMWECVYVCIVELLAQP